MLSLIVAVANNNVIGGQNKLLWNLPADLKHFKDVTSGHAIIMGRKTFESIGRPLPNRQNIVVTRDASYTHEGVKAAHSLEEALELAGHPPVIPAKAGIQLDSGSEAGMANEVFVIGGGELFRQALPLADRVYLTKIDADFEGDAFFPELGPDWKEVSREEGTVDEKNAYPHTFLLFERVK